MTYRAICKCGKDLNEVKSEGRGYAPELLGYGIDFFGGRVSIIKPDFKCECGRVHEVYYETNESGTIAIASKITKEVDTKSNDELEEVNEEVEETIEKEEPKKVVKPVVNKAKKK